MVQCESITSFFQRTDRDGGTALFSSMDIPFPPFGPILHGSGMTSASARKDFSISRTGSDPLNMENGVFSTIPPHKLARMGFNPLGLPNGYGLSEGTDRIRGFTGESQMIGDNHPITDIDHRLEVEKPVLSDHIAILEVGLPPRIGSLTRTATFRSHGIPAPRERVWG